jgi:hypothetical protein
MDISFKSDRLKMSSGRPPEDSVLLASLAGAFSSGASAVAVIVAEPSSEFALLLVLLLALLERVRGVRCDISILLYAVWKFDDRLN